MNSVSSLRLLAAAITLALFASATAHAGEPASSRQRLLDSDSSTLTLQPGALGYYRGAELSAGLATQLDSRNPAQSWDLRLAGGSEGFAGGLLLRQDLEERWWSGYGLGVAIDWLSLGFTSQRSGLPLWATEAEQQSTRLDAGLGLRPASWLSLGYNVGRSATDGTATRADQRVGLAVRDAAGSWGAETALQFDGDGAFAATELGLQRRFGALALRVSARLDDQGEAGGGLFAEYALDGAEISLGATGSSDGVGLVERIALSSESAPEADFGAAKLVVLRLSGPLDERAGGGLFAPPGREFAALLEDVRRAAVDPRVTGLYLELDGCSGGIAQAFELRLALEELRTAGKQVVAYLESAGLIDLYLAGAADWVVASPTVQLLKTGVGGTSYYLAELLEKAGIEAQFVRTGPHKSGPETYLQNGPSDEARAQYEAYLDSVSEELVRGIGRGDATLMERWRALAASAPVTADDLKSAEIVNAIGYNDEVAAAYETTFSRPILWAAEAPWRQARQHRWMAEPAIGVLHIEGEIVEAASPYDLLGGERTVSTATIVAAADALREDETVAGVIIRIDSPGGSAWASDEMAHALKALVAKKPVVVSMGSVAASGGYYVASLGVPIYALPTTLTGSIGVYAGTFSADGLFGKLGVHPVRTERGGATDLLGPHTWSTEERAAIQRSVDHTYDRFLGLVAASRSLTIERTTELAGGRIYAGTRAKELGLVDALTGFEGARKALVEQLGLDGAATPLRHLPEGPQGLSLSAGLGLSAALSEPTSAPLADAVIDALGLGRLLRLARPLLSARSAAPMMHFDGQLPEL